MEPSPGRYIFNSTCNNIISLSHLKLQHFWFNCKYICIECWKSLVQVQPDQNWYLLHYKNSSTVFFWFSAKQTSSDWRSYLFQTSSDWRSYLFQTSSDWRSYLFQTLYGSKNESLSINQQSLLHYHLKFYFIM